MVKAIQYIRKIKAEKQIRSFFENAGKQVFSSAEFAEIIEQHRNIWNLAITTPVQKLMDRFVANEVLRVAEVPFNTGRSYQCYLYGEPSVYEIAVSFYNKSYLTHYTAIFLHGLTTQVPKTIYVTHEQSTKLIRDHKLTQKGIDHAFSQPQRRSETYGVYEDYKIVILNGMQTNRSGVISSENTKGNFPLTGLERTLIDITVRPNYAGGAFMVLETYKRALEQKLSVNKLIATLNNIDFIYPYHQSVGFYLEKAGYKGNFLPLLKKKSMEFDFYLDYNMEETGYSPDWKIYFPKGM